MLHEDDRKRSARVQELEEKIKKLENENQKLTKTVSTTHHNVHNHMKLDEDDELENGLLDIDDMLNGLGELNEDEWLFISPKLPPTPIQKKVTPRQWLSEGHYKEGDVNREFPSLDDVRKNLMYNIDEAESLSDIVGYESSREKSLATKKVHQRPLDKVRQNQASEFLETNGEKEAVPVVKWKARVPIDSPTPTSSPEYSSEEAPQRKWKVKQIPSGPPVESTVSNNITSSGGDTEIGKGFISRGEDEAKVPAEYSHHSDVPVVKWKAKVPVEDSHHSDVPVVKWKAKVPVEDSHHSDVPVVKWKAKVPTEDLSHSGVKQKAKVPSQHSDVPVVKWKAKVPTEDLGVKQKAKVPTGDSQHSDDVPVIKWKAKVPTEDLGAKQKAKVPAGDSQHSDDVPVIKWKANPGLRSPKGVKNQAKVAKIQAGDQISGTGKSLHHEPSNVQHVDKKSPNVRPSRSHQLQSPSSPSLSPVHSPSHSPSHQIQGNSETTRKTHSRRSSISDSRSPSPPSISPQVRMAIASPILSRRTPSPSRGLTGGLGGPRQSPTSSPAMHQKQLQYLSGNQQHSLGSRSSSGLSSPGRGSKIRTPRSQSSSGVKAGSPMKGGLTPPSDRKQRRVLPTTPSSMEGSKPRSLATPTVGVAQRQASPSGGQDIGDDDDSWLEGCF